MEYTLKIAKISSQQLHSTIHRHPKIIEIHRYTHHVNLYNTEFLF
jgi:hypothetical protein